MKPDSPSPPATLSDELSQPGLPGEAVAVPGAIPPEYWRAFSIVAFTMNRFIIDHLIRVSRHFDNDTEALVLFGMLSHLNVAHLLHPGATPTTALSAQGTLPESQPKLRPVRIRDLAHITGRPRETIRRKLVQLEAAGRVTRVADGYVLNVASVDAEMRVLTMDSVRRFLEAARVIDAAIRDARASLARDSAAAPGTGPGPSQP